MFGQRLRLARKQAGLSMQALAESLTPGISAQAINKYEADKMMPSSAVLVGLSKSLGVSLDFLMGGQVHELQSLEWRKTSNASAQDRAKAEMVVIGFEAGLHHNAIFGQHRQVITGARAHDNDCASVRQNQGTAGQSQL